MSNSTTKRHALANRAIGVSRLSGGDKHVGRQASKMGWHRLHGEYDKRDNGFDYVVDGIQGVLFDPLAVEQSPYVIGAKKSPETYSRLPQIEGSYFQLHNRRYIGNKYKLTNWIFSILDRECKGSSFTDIFAGTGIVAAIAGKRFDEIVMNDFLHSNEVIYKAFFGTGYWDPKKVNSAIASYNNVDKEKLDENYFSRNFGGKYFSEGSARVIGFIRENIEKNKENLTTREYYMLLASLLYSVDKIANTVGHYDAYFNKARIDDLFLMKPINPVATNTISIFREDANALVKRLETDIVYIDPPYNSRQYSRFYHLLETLVKWDKPKLHGVALKPTAENMSDYCRVSARDRFAELISDINARYLIVSYNNTYNPKSSSSRNKITLEEIQHILRIKGETKVFEKDYRHFNAGNTDFNDHKEYLFITETAPRSKR